MDKLLDKSKLVLFVLIGVLVAGNIFFGIQYFGLFKEYKALEISSETQQLNTEILSFGKLFIQKVLRAQGEINFDDRLVLENTVRSLKDPRILTQWEKFVDSKTEEEAQERVRDLLESLFNNIKPL